MVEVAVSVLPWVVSTSPTALGKKELISHLAIEELDGSAYQTARDLGVRSDIPGEFRVKTACGKDIDVIRLGALNRALDEDAFYPRPVRPCANCTVKRPMAWVGETAVEVLAPSMGVLFEDLSHEPARGA